MKNKFFALLMFLGGFIGITSCTNELNSPVNSLNLAHNPDIVTYSGEEVLGNTFGYNFYGMTRGSVSDTPHKNYKVQDYTLNENFQQTNPDLYEVMTHAPSAVSNDEWNFVKEYLAEHPNEGGTECNLTDYFVQWCGKSYDNYSAGKDQNGADHNVTGSNHMDYIQIDGVHLPDYNGNWGPIEYLENWPLTDPTYHDSYGNINSIKHDMYRFYYIEYNGEWGLYLCFDYTTQKDSGEYHGGDGVFNDWVLKITPADGVVTPPVPGDGNITGNVVKTTSEVEINLSINDTHIYNNVDINDLVAKLSMHVRYAGDIEVFIPVPETFYCEQDDLYIFENHSRFEYGSTEIKYNVNNNEVTLSVSFEEGGIRINTNGINKEVFDYCKTTNGDGINFEVYLYFNNNEELTFDTLKSYLDQSTVEFFNGYPDYYINAFNDTETGEKFNRDCTVSIIETQENEFGEAKTDLHLNGSAFNEIFKHKDYKGVEGSHDHDFLWFR